MSLVEAYEENVERYIGALGDKYSVLWDYFCDKREKKIGNYNYFEELNKFLGKVVKAKTEEERKIIIKNFYEKELEEKNYYDINFLEHIK